MVVASLTMVAPGSASASSTSWIPAWVSGAPDRAPEQSVLETQITDFLHNDFDTAVDNGCTDALDDYHLAEQRDDHVEAAYEGMLDATLALGTNQATQIAEVATRLGLMAVQVATFFATIPAAVVEVAAAQKAAQAAGDGEASEDLKKLTTLLVSAQNSLAQLQGVIAQGTFGGWSDWTDLSLNLTNDLTSVVAIGTGAASSGVAKFLSSTGVGGALTFFGAAKALWDSVEAYNSYKAANSSDLGAVGDAEGQYALALAELEITVAQMNADAAKCKKPHPTPCVSGGSSAGVGPGPRAAHAQQLPCCNKTRGNVRC